jgi:hypothetical protein
LHAPSLQSFIGRIADQPCKIHFRDTRLKAAAHRRLDPALRLRFAHAFAEQIRIATEIFGRCECDRVTRSLTATRPAAGKPAMRCASDPANSSSASAGEAMEASPVSFAASSRYP